MSETTENVVKSTDVAPKKTPKSFKDLTLEELQAAARVFGTSEEGTKAVVSAALAEDGVTWDMYVKQFQLEGHENIPDLENILPTEVELPDEDEDEDDGKEVEELSNDVATVNPNVELAAAQKYLIKFIGENPYFEFRNYKFTQEKPYGIMPASDAQEALVSEPKKFRQAFPAELSEFYG